MKGCINFIFTSHKLNSTWEAFHIGDVRKEGIGKKKCIEHVNTRYMPK